MDHARHAVGTVLGRAFGPARVHRSVKRDLAVFHAHAHLGGIDIPVGGQPVKYEMDKDAGTVFVDRFLHTPMMYPCNYGFTPHTLSDDGAREIKTAFPCEDMGQSAQCEMTYFFSANAIEIKKMVTYDGETDAFRRNAYTFQR